MLSRVFDIVGDVERYRGVSGAMKDLIWVTRQ